MKKAFIKKRFKKLLLEKEEARTVSQKEIQSIGIISSEEISNWIDVREEVAKIFDLEKIKIYSYKTPNKKNKKDNFYFSEKSFTWKSNISESNFHEFLQEPFDLLIGYFNKPNLYTEMAVLKSNASFKAGISKVNQKLYDIEIAEYPKNIERFLLELKKYLQILKKVKN